MQGDKLIRRSYSDPHLTCTKYPQTLEVLCKIQDDECVNHSGGRSFTQKALNVGYFWPTMHHNCTEYVKRCDRCQRYTCIQAHSQIILRPSSHLHKIPSNTGGPLQNSRRPVWQPLWGQVTRLEGSKRPMPTAPAKKEMMIVAIENFIKWINAETLSSTKEVDVERFIWRNIICRFGCPQSLVTNNGSQFIGEHITAFFKKYGIKQHLSTPRYP
ncbi:hypothetical protein L3X38_018429 [Prunus dulcis]|uniref:Integrase catalytic domain-containing protein n=1 Tax=Prunus dulcis TaxID=3755 RepID=A0AAD4ZA32_PRUDU|nr:hypothetical protein L3X38_018429 [Prunus dulcis]